jgi:hypothetical protein
LPIGVVECFFLAQGPSHLPQGQQTQTANIVIRLAESASQWRQVPVQRRLGHWEDGYITIRGAWTEPIDRALLERLNASLVAAQRAAGDFQEA